MAASRHQDDFIARGVKNTNVAGTITFIGLRAVDPFLQYQILANGVGTGLLTKLGLTTIPLASTVLANSGISIIDNLQLPLPRLILLAMSVGSAAKQIFWLTCIAQEEFPPKSALAVSVFNTFCNSLNSLVLLTAATSAALSTAVTVPLPGTGISLPLPIAVGTVLYVVGMYLETGSELQRKSFKDKKENKGKICREGLWTWARHVNYGGYTLWRGGYALAAGSWVVGTIVAGAQAVQFVNNGMEWLNTYMGNKYGEQWVKYRQEVPYKLIPGIY